MGPSPTDPSPTDPSPTDLSPPPDTLPTVSIVIVSRGRPDSLTWCLRGVAGLRYAPGFEVVVVACPQGAAAVRASDVNTLIKLVKFDEANISAARNAGIAQAAGDVVAFLDDDAVPEPTWLTFLADAMEYTGAAAAGGFVRGRNGISFQWTARSVDACGRAAPLDMAGDGAGIPDPGPGRVVKTEGTNMAVRRAVLERLGGFDPAYRFFLDETDLNLRLAAEGEETVIVPLAQVHHAYAASTRRGENRGVRDLTDIGASTAVFLRKHCPERARPARWDEVQREQQARVDEQARRGWIARATAGPLMEGLRQGWAEGMARNLTAPAPLENAGTPFLGFPQAPGPAVVLAGRIWQARRLRAEAARRAAAGECVSLFLFSPTARYHRVRFTRDGVWEQTGGLFGRAERNEPLFRPSGFRARVGRESERLAILRGLTSEG